MAKNTGIAALFDRSYRTGDPQLDALFGLTDIQEEELPPLRAPERREAPREEAPREIRGQERVRSKGRSGGSGEANLRQAYAYLVNEKGFAPHHAAGIVGNFAQESGGNPAIVGGNVLPNDPHSVGFGQWNRERLYGGKGYTGLIPFAKQRGSSPNDLQTQLDYMVEELSGPERRAFDRLLATDTVEDAARAFGEAYERPRKQYAHYENRIAQAKKYFGSETGQPQQAYTSPQLASTQAPQEPQESPYYPVRLSDGQIVDVEKGMELSEAAAMLKQNGIEATPLRPYTTPDGQEFDVEYDMTDDEVMNILNKPAPGESNYLGAMQHGMQSAVSGMAMGAGTELGALGEDAGGAGFLGDYAQPVSEFLRKKGAQAHTYGEELGKEIEGKYTRPENLNLLEEYVTYPAAETFGQMLPYVAAAPLAAIPGIGPAAATAATLGAVHAGTMGGGEQEAIAAGKEFVPSEYRPYAFASDAANMVGLGAFNKALKVFGKEAILGSREAIQAAVEKGGIEEAKKLVGSRLKNVAGEFLKGEAALVSGEVIEDAINREYLGKPLLDEEAGQQYLETFKQVGPLGLFTGPLAGLGAHYNKATEVARLEEQADVAQKLEAQEMERAKAENLATIGVTPEQLQKFGVRKEIEGLSEEELLQAYQADLAEKEAAKAAKIAELPEDLRDVPYRDAKRFQQMQEEIAAGVPSEEVIPSEEVPSEEVIPSEEVTPPVSEPTPPVSEPTLPVTEPSAPVEPVSGVTPPTAEVDAEEIPEPFVRGRTQEVQAPEQIIPEAPELHFSDELAIASKSGKKKDIPLKKALEGLDIANPAHQPTIVKALEIAIPLAEKGSIQLDIPKAQAIINQFKPVEAPSAQQIPQAGPIIKEVRGVRAPEIEVEGVKRPTTDSTGAPIHTTEEGIKNFWKWFGDSKAVDAEGRPVRLYHGTQQSFDEFDPSGEGAFGRGVYLSGIPGRTEQYTKRQNQGAGGNIMPVYLKMSNPSEITNALSVKPTDKESANKFTALQQRLIKEGYDGSLSWLGNDVWEAVAFHPNQIKSAIGNKGEFDVTKPDIREVQPESPDIGKLPLDVAKFHTAKNARELLNTFAQHGTDENLLKKAKIFQTSPHAGAVRTHFVSMSDQMPQDVRNAFENRGALAATSIGPEQVEIYYRKDSPEAFSEDNVIHEVTHALTEAGLQRNPALNTELNSLAGAIGKAIEKDHPEAAAFWRDVVKEDGSEALAYGATSPTFRKILSQYDENGNRIPEAEPETPVAQKPRTLWDRFKSFVGKLFGVPDKQKENFSKAVDEALAKGTGPVVKPISAKLDQALVQAFKDTAKRGITKPKETTVKEVRGEAPIPKLSKAEAKQAEERLKAAGLTGKITEEPLGTKMRRVTNDIFKEGRNTSFAAEYVDIRQPIAKAVQDLPSNVGEKLRSDYIWGAYEQRGNVLQESYRKGFIAMGRDGTLEAIPDAQLAVENIFKRVGKENAKVFGDVLVAHRVRSIRKKDAEIHAQANKLLNMAEQMEDYASTLKDAAKRKKFNASARSLYKAAEKKLEIINWGEGRTEFSEELAKEADKVLAANPHLAREAENVYALLRKQVDLWEQEGMIDKAMANEWRNYPNYFPLYKSSATDAKGDKISYDEMLANPTEYIQKHITPYMGRGAKSLPKVHKQEWHQHAVFVEENLLRHLAFFASAAAEHSARKNTAYNMELLGKAARQEHGKGDFVVKFREKGKDVFYKIEDPAAYYALQSAQPLLNPLLKHMRSVGNFARGVMIMNPLFWYRQVFREPLQASLVGRAGVITPFDTLGEIAKIATGKSEGYERLRAKGVIGPVDVIPDVAEYVKTIHNGKGSLQKSIDGIKHVHEAADAATRAVVYERAKAQAISQGFTEEVADSIGVMKAREIINFAKQGRGDLIRVARATTPFFGAALNSLDVMARAISPEKLGSLSKAEAMEARRNFYSTAMMVAVFSTAYAAAMSEDEDYLKNPDRKGNWLVPIGGGKFIKIPIPFEAGWFIKELPELATLLSLGAINKSEAITEGKTAFKENVLPPMPTVFSIEPLAEVIMDHDFYTGSSLEGRDAEVAVRDRNTKAGELTKAIVNKMEDYGINFLGMSANQLEHLNKSYLGQVWAITRAASDAYLNHGKVTPEKALSEYPMVGGIISEGKKDRAVDQFYRVYGQVSEIDKSKQRAVSIGDKERFDQIVHDPDNQKALQASDALRDIKKQIGEKRTGIAKIKEMKGITSEEMTKRINVLKEHEKMLAKRGVEVARKLGLEI